MSSTFIQLTSWTDDMKLDVRVDAITSIQQSFRADKKTGQQLKCSVVTYGELAHCVHEPQAKIMSLLGDKSDS